VVRADLGHLHLGLCRREYAVDHDDEAVVGAADAGAALVDVLDLDGDLFAGLDGLGLQPEMGWL